MDQRWVKWVVCVLGASLTATAASAMTERDYFSALQFADQHVRKLKDRRTSRAGALLSAPAVEQSDLVSLHGRPWKKGDHWLVVMLKSEELRAAPPSAEGELSHTRRPELALFEYQVVESQPGGDVWVRVEPRSDWGILPVDPRVRSILLRTDESLRQKSKQYIFGTTHWLAAPEVRVGVSPDGLRSPITPLELYPLDLPRLDLGEGKRVLELPALPEPLRAVAKSTGYRIEPSQGMWFEEQDFFGRPVSLFWRQGDPWPAYLKTPYGVSLLIEGESR